MRLARSRTAAGTVPVAASGDRWFSHSPLSAETGPGTLSAAPLARAAETGAAQPAEPVVFMKAPDTVAGSGDDVLIPRRSVKTDSEVELAVVLGATARQRQTFPAA